MSNNPRNKTKSNGNKKEDTKSKSRKNSQIPFNRMKAYLDLISKLSHATDNVELAITVMDDTSKVLDCDRSTFFFVDGDYRP